MKIFNISLCLSVLCLLLSAVSQAQTGCDLPYEDKVSFNPITTGVEFEPETDGGGSEPIDEADIDRIIYWIHGLSGDPSAWARASSATSILGAPDYPARKVFSLNPTYTEFDLQNAGWNLHQSFVTMGDVADEAIGNPSPTRNFAIAHSQGGLVTRAVDKIYADYNMESERRIGGIVTFGTAHQGAMILNNYNDILDYADDICTELSAGPVTEYIDNSFLLRSLVSNNTLEAVVDQVCGFFSQTILPVALSDYQATITQDYEVGAADLAELNSHVSQIPNVAFYGIEQEPILWRTIQYLGIDNPNDYDPFEANEDSEIISRVEENRLKYLDKFIHYTNRVNYLETDLGMPCSAFQWIFTPGFCLIYEMEYWRKLDLAEAWEKGYRWWNNANTDYKAMIGAIDSELVPQLYCSCLNQDEGPSDPDWDYDDYVYPISNPGQCPTECETYINQEIQVINHPSDGVVLAESAAGMPGADFVGLLSGSNHMQMRNDKNLKRVLRSLFEGQYGNYFITAPRD